MQNQHKRLLDRIDWDGWRGTDGRHVDCEDKDLDSALSLLERMTEEIIEDYGNSQRFTPPSRKRREAKQRARYRQQKRVADRPTRGSS